MIKFSKYYGKIISEKDEAINKLKKDEKSFINNITYLWDMIFEKNKKIDVLEGQKRESQQKQLKWNEEINILKRENTILSEELSNGLDKIQNQNKLINQLKESNKESNEENGILINEIQNQLREIERLTNEIKELKNGKKIQKGNEIEMDIESDSN